MRLCANWLPLSPGLTRQVAAQCEAAGLWGMGIGDSPNYGELYSACTDALGATSSLVVSTSVTNPVTRHWSVHASAVRTLTAAHPGRFRLGFGRGDSAVHTFGLRPASPAGLEDFGHSVAESARAAGVDPFLLVAASGPATARSGGRVADGVIAGVGGDPVALGTIRECAQEARDAAAAPLEIWASMRIAIGRDDDEVRELRRRLVPRAVSASHFAFASTFEGKNVPAEYADVLAERYATYDYGSHGRSGATSNATMFADRPDIEDYLLGRFAVVGRADECRARLEELSAHVDGIYLSLLFEDALPQIDRIGAMLA
ncbi:LLM class flavin-dependent oxidoreductase [Actinomadura mexicana]|uniref:Flavin-dependent oxidoreductase, luciferase family (Includes alkanesulfonate monooxygenase SsuD and methylene tetrahydromethanopterin reductase) n=1 Tax=Actinomadura mexicana TaxID=134959 RepID=A0A238XB19_9ACTN|nr:LLM class flavin-dependent oxidoreductase [Actinomadura mexicana]SNR55733.1 Flavin-dependent oxidoreductase, luciferase family (includes alkanesulfonate monooxygenase SsuD and methylene tetrahydromethanopterin reductase) [Actinomadura mexicana]